MRVLDSHLHMWDPAVLDYDWLPIGLRRRFGPEQLADARSTSLGADAWAGVFVQADARPGQGLAEVDWVSALSASAGIRGIVAHASLERGAPIEEELDALRGRPLVVGVRRLLQDEPSGFATAGRFVVGARRLASAGLTFDAGARWWQLPDVLALADAVPDLEIVLDHLGKPAVGGDAAPADTAWRDHIRALAERPRTWCKVSGLPAETSGSWTAAQVVPFLDAALEAFGPDRLLFGSDWPVSDPYDRWLSTVVDWVEDRVGDVDAVLWQNAERAYRLR